MNLVFPPKFSVAPMIDYTDRHFLKLCRILSPHALLYTEMITANAILKGGREFLLSYDMDTNPVVLQIAGYDPEILSDAAKLGELHGYSGINLNVGCPSNRVQNGNFGACLMAKPKLVANILREIKASVKIPVSIKHRIGIDGLETKEDLFAFVKQVSEESGVDWFIVHARIAILSGLSPHQNRSVPPLRYHDVYELKQKFPHLKIELNGGIVSVEEMQKHLHFVDGVMLGRKIIEDCFFLNEVEERFFLNPSVKTRTEVWNAYLEYTFAMMERSFAFSKMGKHLLSLFHGIPGARGFRRELTKYLQEKNPSRESLDDLYSRFFPNASFLLDAIPFN